MKPSPLKLSLVLILFGFVSVGGQAQSGYNLWLYYFPIENESTKNMIEKFTMNLYNPYDSEMTKSSGEELNFALSKMLDHEINLIDDEHCENCIRLIIDNNFTNIEDEGFHIISDQSKSRINIHAKKDKGHCSQDINAKEGSLAAPFFPLFISSFFRF